MLSKLGQACSFANIMQLAYIVDDMDAAVDIFRKRFGIPAFLDLRHIKLQTGSNDYAIIDLGLAIVDGIQIELISPKGGSDHVYRSVLTGSPGEIRFHHICQYLENAADFDAMRAAAIEGERELVLWGESSRSGARYFYLDDRATLGHYTEYITRPADQEAIWTARIPSFSSKRLMA